MAGLLVSSGGVLVGALVAGVVLARAPQHPVNVVVDLRARAPLSATPPEGDLDDACVCRPCEALEPEEEEPEAEEEAVEEEEPGSEGDGRMRSCLAPFEGEPWSEPPEGEPEVVMHDVPRVAVSRAAFGVVATWFGDDLLVSFDDGESFESVEGSPSDLVDVAVGARGTVFVLRAESLDLLSPDGRVESRALPCHVTSEEDPDSFPSVSWVAVGGGHVAVLCQPQDGPRRLALSRDGGRTWRLRRVPDEDFGVRHYWSDPFTVMDVAIDPRGRLTVVDRRPTGEGDYYGIVWQSGIGSAWHLVAELQGSPGLGHDRTLYLLGWGCDYYDGEDDWDGHGLGSIDGRRRCRHLLELPEPDLEWEALQVAHNGSQTFGLIGARLLRLHRRRAEVVSAEAPADLAYLAVDSCDRVLGVRRGELLRWAPGTGFRLLHSWPTPPPESNDGPPRG